ncbi:MAG: hypothetical protein LBU67_03990 [Oscillospiraceae bacterium]|nr:hypothetical protein [Oscillospiraceae bacterium]
MRKYFARGAGPLKRALATLLCLVFWAHSAPVYSFWVGIEADLMPAPAAPEQPPERGQPQPLREEPAHTEAPARQTDAPRATEPPNETAAPHETEPPRPTDIPQESETPAETDVPQETGSPQETEAPAGTDTPQASSAPEPTAEPQNAHEFSGFTHGYVRVMTATQVRTEPHDRAKSEEVLALNEGEVVLAVSRRAFEPAPREEAPEDAPDWFRVRARDCEDVLVTGYVSGTELFPLTKEETDSLLSAWREEDVPVGQDGVPRVGGAFVSPGSQEEGRTVRPEKTATPQPGETPSPAGTAQPEPTSAPDVTLPPEATQPPESPLPWEEEEAGPPEPTATPDPLAESLARAEELLAEGEGFLEAATQRARNALAAAALPPDTTAPVINDTRIQQSAQSPVTEAVLLIYVTDPAGAGEQVSGVDEVYIMLNGRRYDCVYDAQLGAYTVTVYDNDSYAVHAVDAAGNPAVPVTLTVTSITNANPGAADTTPPQVDALDHDPTGWCDSLTVTAQVSDPPGAGQTASGVRDVWITGPAPATDRIACGGQGTDWMAELTQNGSYELHVRDRAGNVAVQAFVIDNLRADDTYPPLADDAVLDPPPRDDGFMEPFVEASVRTWDVPRPGANPPERATGVALVQVAWREIDPRTDQPIYEVLGECYTMQERNRWGYTLQEDGNYSFLIFDGAGNLTVRDFYIGHIGVNRTRIPNPDWYLRPVDDDGDGLYTETEYRLGLNPANRDTNGDGLWDGLSVRLGFSGSADNPKPARSVLARAGSAAPLEKLVAAGVLAAPLTETRPANARRDMQSLWRSLRNTVAWMTRDGDALLCVNSRSVFTAHMPSNERLVVDGALNLYTLGMQRMGKGEVRSLEATADGSMALLYDRQGHGGLLARDAYLIDTARMQAYRVPQTQGARSVAISPDGAHLAIWRPQSLTRVSVATAETLQITDPARCAAVDMLRFLPDGTLITRATALGYSALGTDGERVVGLMQDLLDLPCLIQWQDVQTMTLVDREMRPLTIELQLLLRSTGLFVDGEPPKQKIARNLSPREMYERSVLIAGLQ